MQLHLTNSTAIDRYLMWDILECVSRKRMGNPSAVRTGTASREAMAIVSAAGNSSLRECGIDEATRRTAALSVAA